MKFIVHRLLPLALLCAALQPLHASTSLSREWRFQVFLDDKPVGYHHFHLDSNGDRHELRSETSLRVKILGLTVYDYTHQSVELWQQDCLQQIESSTDQNGKEFFVRGSSNGEQLLLDNQSDVTSLPGCVMTFAYWNPAILQQERLLNTQTGEYLDVRIQDLGVKPLSVQGRTMPALHFLISTGERNIELRYSSERDWLGLSSTTSSGRQLHYRRVDNETAALSGYSDE